MSAASGSSGTEVWLWIFSSPLLSITPLGSAKIFSSADPSSRSSWDLGVCRSVGLISASGKVGVRKTTSSSCEAQYKIFPSDSRGSRLPMKPRCVRTSTSVPRLDTKCTKSSPNAWMASTDDFCASFGTLEMLLGKTWINALLSVRTWCRSGVRDSSLFFAWRLARGGLVGGEARASRDLDFLKRLEAGFASMGLLWSIVDSRSWSAADSF
mmetsp:Transcript_11544/g.43115  ORF Transcript_11544/g.43115 Transcript_11544/m.43115 type:complete len:211 (-) Transcript_11544:2951-3583(-)